MAERCIVKTLWKSFNKGMVYNRKEYFEVSKTWRVTIK